MNRVLNRRTWSGLLLVVLGWLGQVAAVWASDGAVTANDLLAANSSGDAANSIFTYALGDFWTNPMSMAAHGGGAGVLGAMFLIFNGAIFAIGVVWASYGVLSAVTATAETGEALGRSMSVVWVPVRMTTGFVGIVPAFGGFSLSQVLLVAMAAMGTGMANLMTTSAVNSLDSFQTLVPASGAVSNSAGKGFDDAADALFEMHVCELAIKSTQADATSFGIPIKDQLKVQKGPVDSSVIYQISSGVGASPTGCGSVKISASDNTRNSWSVGFRSGAVNYDAYKAYAQAVQPKIEQAYIQAIQSFDAVASAQAAAWFNARYSASQTGAVQPYPTAAMTAAVNSAQTNAMAVVSQAAADATAAMNGGAISSGVKEKMLSMGWVGLGSWYQAYAEAGAAMSSAMNSVSLSIDGTDLTGAFVGDAAQEAIRAVEKSRMTAGDGVSQGTASSDDGALSAMGLLTRRMFGGGNDTGNYSFGQWLVKKSIEGASVGSAGNTDMINPIIMSKNIGDTVLAFSSLILTVQAVDKVVSDGDNSVIGGNLLDGVTSMVGKVVPGVKVLSVLKKALAGIMSTLVGMLPYLIILGLLLSIYIPMVPFMTWMGGLIQYFVVVAMGLVGMPIAAFSHLDAQGEGLGRRTEAGYMFILNVLFRPALMCMGFMFASVFLVALGTLEAKLFMTAMANAQGNSITGLLSIPGYLAVFFVMQLALVQGMFNMIFLFPDQILGLVGSLGTHADLGKDMESKVHATFMAFGRNGQMAFSKVPGAGKGPSKGGAA